MISFNETVGHRVADAGYKEAPVIVDGEVQPGIGGGICQVSSTLYNAILLANLTASERSVHYYPSSYVRIGFDATVADDLLDLKFSNTLSHTIYLLTEVQGGTLTICVLGNSADRSGEELRLTLRGGAVVVGRHQPVTVGVDQRVVGPVALGGRDRGQVDLAGADDGAGAAVGQLVAVHIEGVRERVEGTDLL